MITQKRKVQYRIRYHNLIQDLHDIYKIEPKEKYMYPLMDRVIFQDFETALSSVLEDYKIANDNKS
ncbi:MAG: hypothetical protein AAF244_00970 [Pseudomonadota bacterium]